MGKPMTDRQVLANKIWRLSQKLDEVRDGLKVEDNSTQCADEALKAALDLLKDAQFALEEDDPNQEEHLETGV